MNIRKLLIFDMDGTMFDTEPSSYRCWRDVSARYGFNLDRQVFDHMLGRDNRRIRAICDDAFGPSYPYDAICREKVALQLDYYRTHDIPVKPGLLQVLHYAREAGMACAVASSSPRALIEYLLDKTVQITASIVGFIIAILMLNAFKVENDLKIALTILFF